MVTVMFCYAECNHFVVKSKYLKRVIDEKTRLSVADTSEVLFRLASDSCFHGRYEIAVFLDGEVAFKDSVNINLSAVGKDCLLSDYLKDVARHYDREGQTEKRNSILCLLGAIALDEAE